MNRLSQGAAGPAGDEVTTPEALYREHYQSLVRVAALMTDSCQLGEEVVQDVFAEIVDRWDTIDPARVEHYLRRAVSNRCRSVLRRRGTARRHVFEVAGTAPPPDDAVLRRVDEDRLAAGVAALPLRQRQVLVLRYYSDASIAQTADALGISQAAVTTSTYRALRALAALKEDLR